MDKTTAARLKKPHGGPVAHVEAFAGWDKGQWCRVDIGAGKNALHLYVPAGHPLAQVPVGMQIRISAVL